MYNDIGWYFQWRKLFSSDYWFTVELGNGRNFKGHFSLKHFYDNLESQLQHLLQLIFLVIGLMESWFCI
jgi:hypothetical protein